MERNLCDDEGMKTVLVSGGFDPVHSGHVEMFMQAAMKGRVVVALNSDEWLERKKGYVFMPFRDRKLVVSAMRAVHYVTGVDDGDGTVLEAIRRIRPDYFANGGDRTSDNTPELELCYQLGIEPLFGIGGFKQMSSSGLVDRACEIKAGL